ncbi:stage VI sporulation protein F [Alkalibacillus salilacus]|uniref:Stage VI sporulation protein F n=1 Tax=Alkalibacillus salilacus TaxID=284582 RepID=A0ABT9VCA6_9BACI|nr:stage VI sporulation protein F [Alkalibacillus salilacus]MDQ0158495.1 hypothetical protein [Alkalibacillus salilacus]
MNREFQQSIFDHLKESANISSDDILQVAQSVQNADFSDERTVRQLVRHLARMARKPLSQEREDKIVKTIVHQNGSLDASTLQQIFKK